MNNTQAEIDALARIATREEFGMLPEAGASGDFYSIQLDDEGDICAWVDFYSQRIADDDTPFDVDAWDQELIWLHVTPSNRQTYAATSAIVRGLLAGRNVVFHEDGETLSRDIFLQQAQKDGPHVVHSLRLNDIEVRS
jgi:hypothetical protein